MGSKSDRSSPDELASDSTDPSQSIEDACRVLRSVDQGVVFFEEHEDPLVLALAITQVEQERRRPVSVLWAHDRSWLAWHWPIADAVPLVGFVMPDEVQDVL